MTGSVTTSAKPDGKERSGRLRWRLVGASAIIGPVLALLWLDGTVPGGRPGIWLLPLAALLVAAGVGELHVLVQFSLPVRQGPWITILLAELALLVSVAPIFVRPGIAPNLESWCYVGLALTLVLMLRMLIAMAAFQKPSGHTLEIALSLFQIVYVVLPLVFLFHLRLEWSDTRGLWALASIPWVVKISDSGAYFAGRYLGRHSMAPLLSPKKTWEGAVGGLVAAVAATGLFFLVEPHANTPSLVAQAPWWMAVPLGLSLGVAGMLGDLSESLLKRDLHRKDSAAWIPGLGGTLDVLDSVFWAAPVGY
ncbi:MAG TPA: phosphatidate cytidylyltransferase, partial [Pirellulaceae bacterium]